MAQPTIEDIILEKTFRKRENWNKVQFIISNTDIDLALIAKAAAVARRNEFHNFGHQIGATEMGIKIAQAENLEPETINIIGLALLFHDGSHRRYVTRFDEARAVRSMTMVLEPADIKHLTSETSTDNIFTQSKELILATQSNKRGMYAISNREITHMIMQDADLAHLGLGSVYWLYASMGLVDEFSRQEAIPLSPVQFIRERQLPFIEFLKETCGQSVYQSQGARQVLRNPAQDVYDVLSYNDTQIIFAYHARREDLTLEAFTEELKKRGPVFV